MNRPSDIDLKKTSEVPPFRTALKSAVAEPHTQLEKLRIMKRYASGVSSLEEYLHVTRVLQTFWLGYQPASNDLPIDYARFAKDYLQALERDLGSFSPLFQVKSVHEIAFYYVMLGSGLGAKVILKNNLENDYPKQNIHYLAGNSALLWKGFIGSHLSKVSVSDQRPIINSARLLFQDLLNHMLPETRGA